MIRHDAIRNSTSSATEESSAVVVFSQLSFPQAPAHTPISGLENLELQALPTSSHDLFYGSHGDASQFATSQSNNPTVSYVRVSNDTNSTSASTPTNTLSEASSFVSYTRAFRQSNYLSGGYVTSVESYTNALPVETHRTREDISTRIAVTQVSVNPATTQASNSVTISDNNRNVEDINGSQPTSYVTYTDVISSGSYVDADQCMPNHANN